MDACCDPQTFCRQNGIVSSPKGDGSDRRCLPSEQMAQAHRRLLLLTGVLSVMVLVPLIAGLIMHELTGAEPSSRLLLDRGRHGGLLLLSLGLVAWLRLGKPGPDQVVALAGTYQVLGALIMSLSFFAVDPVLQATPSQLTWLGVWILFFPLVAPTTPWTTAGLAAASALTAPLVFAAGTLVRGEPWPASAVLVGTFLPYLTCAGLSVIPSAVLQGLGRDLRAARAVARELGAYQLIEKIGEGGMGEVWRAEHRLLARPAAVKLIRPPARPDLDPGGILGVGPQAAIDDGEDLALARKRFEREARATARLRSPHTVGLYDYGITADGTAYYAMELLEGLDLEQAVRHFGPMSPGRALHVLLQVCESLAEAHAAGLIHRDIKPANVFLARMGLALDVVKVMDFGLVAFERRAAASARVTDPGFIVGTPAYMAPEQITEADRVDARSDIYALGCLLYWLLTGTPVFDDSSPMRAIVDHAKTAPEPPSARNPDVPPDLDAVVLACLAKSPDDRPQTALELRARLARCAAAGTWTPEHAFGWWRRHVPELATAAPLTAPTRDPRETVLVTG